MLPMPSQGVNEGAERVGRQLGMGSNQPQLHFDHSDETLFEILVENVIEWTCHPQRISVPGVVKPMKLPILAIVGYPPESHRWLLSAAQHRTELPPLVLPASHSGLCNL